MLAVVLSVLLSHVSICFNHKYSRSLLPLFQYFVLTEDYGVIDV